MEGKRPTRDEIEAKHIQNWNNRYGEPITHRAIFKDYTKERQAIRRIVSSIDMYPDFASMNEDKAE